MSFASELGRARLDRTNTAGVDALESKSLGARLMTAPAPGRVVGRYLLSDYLASGGMASIHLARLLGQEGFSRTVCIKKLHPQFAQDPEFVAMFRDEARLAARIRHPNVVSPLDVVAAEGELFIVMDYIHGESLAALLRAARGPIPTRIAASIAIQALLGLHAAHEATGDRGEPLHIVHRDVSPQNILVGEDGVARIVDFGIAKAASRSRTTQDGSLKGKLGYMAPEQLELAAIDRRVDVYTAGVVLWEMLSGRGLFVADSPAAAVEQMLHAEVVAPSTWNPALIPELDALVLRALARRPEERFSDCKAMATALERTLAPAGALEVGAWVEGLVGPELARRAERVAFVEARSSGEITLPVVPVLAHGPVTQLAGLAAGVSAAHPVSSEILGVALGADSDGGSLRNTRGAFQQPKKRVLAFALFAALTLVILIAAFTRRGTPEHDRNLPPIGTESTLSAASPAPSNAAALDVTPLRALAPANALEVVTQPTPLAKASATPGRVVRAPLGAARESGRPHASASHACDVPFKIDANGVKRFNPACF